MTTILITTNLFCGHKPYLCFVIFTFLSTFLSNIHTYPTLLFCHFRSGIREGSFMYLHAHLNAFICGNILAIYSAGINNWMSTTETCLS